MRVNIENLARVGGEGAKAWALDELVHNLKELRDRTNAGDMTALGEFFAIFVFDDNQDQRAAPKGGSDLSKPQPKIDTSAGCVDGSQESGHD